MARAPLMFLVLGGCSLLVNLDDLHGGGADGGGPDVVEPDQFAVDASDEDAGLRCDSASAIFCDDFDQGPFGAKWTKTNASPGATVALDDGGAAAPIPSPPFALSAATPPTDGGASLSASLELDLATTMHHVRSGYDLYIDALSLNSCAIGGLYQVDGVTNAYGFSLLAKPGTTSLYIEGTNDLPDGGSTSDARTMTPIPMQTWVRVVLDVDFDGGTLTLTIESPPGVPATPTFDHVPIAPLATAPSMHLFAGIQYVYGFMPNPECRVYVDDVLLESL